MLGNERSSRNERRGPPIISRVRAISAQLVTRNRALAIPRRTPAPSIDRFESDRRPHAKLEAPRLTLVLPERPVDGLAYFEAVIIARIRAAVARGERCAVV